MDKPNEAPKVADQSKQVVKEQSEPTLAKAVKSKQEPDAKGV